ncbi:MAG TPA: hypothetical protein PK668_03475 [Myxococcota bacterium]|nr:hypothetical protein [Myxococcota bacterium]HRY91916.1 hypothetical protein [Myxococcota bacterium]HSA21100.1 hypothetical protein [Myxococcota bacterium]
MSATRHLRTALLALLACAALSGPARAEDKPLLVHFAITGDERMEELLPLINAEVFIALEAGGKYRLMSQDQLGEHLIMDPAENLAFCNQDPGCISDLTTEVHAAFLMYGDAKLSFDGKKVILHLVLLDTLAKKQADERFGQFTRDGPLVQQAGDLVRELLGLPKPPPPEPPKVAPKPAPDEAGLEAGKGAATAGGKPPAAAPEAAAPPAAAIEAPDGPSPWTNPWTWSTFGVGIAAIGAGVALGVLADQKESDATSAANLGRPQEAYGLVQDAGDLALGANISYGVGGALVLTGVVLFIVDAVSGPSEEPPPPAAGSRGEPAPAGGATPGCLPSVGCGPEGCGASLTLRF